MKRHCAVTAISAIALFTGAALAQEPSGAPSQPAVSVSLGGSASAPAPAAQENPAADSGSSSDSKKDETDPKPANYEFGFVTVGANQAWNIVGRVLFFGMGGGVGAPLYRYSKFKDQDAGWNKNLDIVYGNIFLRFAPVPYVDLDFGPKLALGATLWDVVDPPESAFSYGGYADLRVGSRKVKFGPRFEYVRMAHSNFYETGWIFTPLMARVVH
jgi:hypothetical protein